MKQLKEMKREFSLENKKLKKDDLKAVNGANCYETSENATCYDKKTYTNSGQHLSTLYIGEGCAGL